MLKKYSLTLTRETQSSSQNNKDQTSKIEKHLISRCFFNTIFPFGINKAEVFMQYDDEALPTLTNFEEMARAYNLSLKEKGFVFVNLEQEGKNLLVADVFDLFFRLRASYRYLGSFMSSKKLLEQTEADISQLRSIFDFGENKGYYITTNVTKCFLNALSLENKLSLKLLLLSQKCEVNDIILSIIIQREKMLSQILEIENTFKSIKNK